jgi:hypothetical protein
MASVSTLLVTTSILPIPLEHECGIKGDGCKNAGARLAGRPPTCANQKLIWAPSLNSRAPRIFDGFSQFGPYWLLMNRTVLALNRL